MEEEWKKLRSRCDGHIIRVAFGQIKMIFSMRTGVTLLVCHSRTGYFLTLGLSFGHTAAVAAMIFSSFSVLASSLALRWRKKPSWICVEALDWERSVTAGDEVEDSRIRLGLQLLWGARSCEDPMMAYKGYIGERGTRRRGVRRFGMCH
jgi:hypothetical protein